MASRFSKVPDDLLEYMGQQGLDVYARLIFLELLFSRNTSVTNNFHQSTKFLADRTGFSKRKIQYSIEELVAAGMITEVSTRKFKGGDISLWSVEPGLRKFEEHENPQPVPFDDDMFDKKRPS